MRIDIKASDISTGSPVPYATVSIGSRIGHTDEKGIARFEIPDPDDYMVKVRSGEFEPFSRVISLVEPTTITAKLKYARL